MDSTSMQIFWLWQIKISKNQEYHQTKKKVWNKFKNEKFLVFGAKMSKAKRTSLRNKASY